MYGINCPYWNLELKLMRVSKMNPSINFVMFSKKHPSKQFWKDTCQYNIESYTVFGMRFFHDATLCKDPITHFDPVIKQLSFPQNSKDRYSVWGHRRNMDSLRLMSDSPSAFMEWLTHYQWNNPPNHGNNRRHNRANHVKHRIIGKVITIYFTLQRAWSC